MRPRRAIYCTSYCNHAHYLDTGRPIGHECYAIPPAALAAERDGDMEKAIGFLQKMNRTPIKGRAIKGDVS